MKGEFQPPNYSYVDIGNVESEIHDPVPKPVPVEASFRESTQMANDSPAGPVEPIPEPAPFDPSPAPFVPEQGLFPPEPVAASLEELISGHAPIQPGPELTQAGRAQVQPSSAPLPSVPPQQPEFVAPFASWDASRQVLQHSECFK